MTLRQVEKGQDYLELNFKVRTKKDSRVSICQLETAPNLKAVVERQKCDFSVLDKYMLDFDAASITDSTSVSAEHSVVLAIQEWSKSPDSQMLWVIGALEKVYPSSTSSIAASVVNCAFKLSIPMVSYFCDWPAKRSRNRDPVVSILYSLIGQLLQLLSGTIDNSFHLSDGRLQLLNDTEQSLDEALRLIKELVWLVPPLTLCVLDGINNLDYLQRNRSSIEALLLILKERVTLEGARVDKSLGTFKLLFTTAGNCALLNKMGRDALKEVKCYGRGQRRRPGKAGPGKSTLQLTGEQRT
jgi:hypothetical protein